MESSQYPLPCLVEEFRSGFCRLPKSCPSDEKSHSDIASTLKRYSGTKMYISQPIADCEWMHYDGEKKHR